MSILHPGTKRPSLQSKEKTFPSLNQTGESSSLDLNLGCCGLSYSRQPCLGCRLCGVGGSALFSDAWFRGPYTKASRVLFFTANLPKPSKATRHLGTHSLQSSLVRLVTRGWARQVFVEGGWPLTTWCVHLAPKDQEAQPPI